MQWREELKAAACKWGRHSLALFLAVMAVLTMVARAVDSYVVPAVSVCALEEMQLTYELEIQGRVGTKGKRALYCQEGLRIENVWVQENDVVHKGDLLFTLDMADLQDKIGRKEQEIYKYDLQVADTKHGSQVQESPQNPSAGGEGFIVTPDQAGEEGMGGYGNEGLRQGSEGLRQGSEGLRQGSHGFEAEESNAAALLQIEKEDVEKSLQQLYALREGNGQVYAEFAGNVFACNVSTGSLTSTEPLLILEDFRQPFQFEGTVGGSGQAYGEEGTAREITGADANGSGAAGDRDLAAAGNQYFPREQHFNPEEGLEGSLAFANGDIVLEGVKISEVAESGGGSYRVLAEIEDGLLPRTGNAALSLTKESKRYRKCIPLSALCQEGSGYYVIVVKEEKTILGLQSVAEFVPVALLENNDEYAAVEGSVSAEDKIIYEAGRAVREGERVRVR